MHPISCEMYALIVPRHILSHTWACSRSSIRESDTLAFRSCNQTRRSRTSNNAQCIQKALHRKDNTAWQNNIDEYQKCFYERPISRLAFSDQEVRVIAEMAMKYSDMAVLVIRAHLWEANYTFISNLALKRQAQLPFTKSTRGDCYIGESERRYKKELQ